VGKGEACWRVRAGADPLDGLGAAITVGDLGAAITLARMRTALDPDREVRCRAHW